MGNIGEDMAHLALVNRHIEELDERIAALGNRMATMTLERYQTHNQEILLSTMLEIRKELEKYRAELAETVSPAALDVFSREAETTLPPGSISLRFTPEMQTAHS